MAIAKSPIPSGREPGRPPATIPSPSRTLRARSGTETATRRRNLIEGSAVSMVLGDANRKQLFAEGTYEPTDKFDMGYDVRLGGKVTFVTRGKEDPNIDDGKTRWVYPGETIIAESYEQLDLHDDVCATGSPKMSLLLNGLWSHGGKTDFGFSGHLRLGFTHLGTRPVAIKFKDRIFSVTFWQVRGQTTPRRGGGNHERDSVRESVLDRQHAPFSEIHESTRGRDGILAWRIVRLMELRLRRIRWIVGLLALGAILLFATGLWVLLRPDEATLAAIVALVGSPASLIGAGLLLLRKEGMRRFPPPAWDGGEGA